MATKEYFIPEHYGNKVSTVDNEGKRKWIYAFQPRGKFYKYRTWLSWFYIILFFGMPFIKINGNPIFLFNIPEGKFSLFGQLFLPQDFVILAIAMLLGIVFIIVFTLLFGRVFCGWVCPQTIFMEMMFRKIEFWIEGPAHVQMKMAKQKVKPRSYYIKRGLKHIIFFGISFVIANTFLSYIIGVDALIEIIRAPFGQHLVGFIALLAFTAVFYFVYAYVREIVCTVICPYGRLQSVLMDKNSMAVAYNYNRGEPRGRKRKGNDDLGDCIDCGMCVNVCHTGIDIRDGLQMECVNCTACMDACDDMMIRVGKPTGLITVASEKQLETNTVGEKSFDLRKKLMITLLIVLTGAFTALIVSRSIFDSTVMRVPGQLYQENADGTVSNLYKIKLVSKSAKTLPYHLEVKEKEAELIYVGQPLDSLRTGEHMEETFFIKIPQDKIKSRKEDLHVQIMSEDRVIQTKTVSFLSGY
ncbi:MAG: cytochrome c oxidase accessory protein CcoG [Flavobacteriia bacterium]|nr:cytochrome c oxidase accessory protein CcoG [Flavobacteriia bacterium]